MLRFCHRMNTLMAEQMDQCQVAIDIFAPLRLCQAMVNLKFFLIEERFSTFGAATFLSLRQLLLENVRSRAFAACRFIQ